MGYKALTFLELAGQKYGPGDEVDESVFEEAGQTKENIKNLIADGVISKDMDAPVNEAHVAPEPEAGVISTNDGGSGGA
jgi:hypothetical protein